MLKSFENRSAFVVVNFVASLGLAKTPWILGYAAVTTAETLNFHAIQFFSFSLFVGGIALAVFNG